MTPLENLIADLAALHKEAGKTRGRKEFAEMQLRKINFAIVTLEDVLEGHIKRGEDITKRRAESV